MNNTMKSILVLGSLLLGSAQATAMNAATSASATATAEVRSAVLLDAMGRIVGTVNQNGQVIARGALNTATQAQVTFQGGATKTFTLAKTIGANTRTTLETVAVRSGNSMVSLGSAIRADLQARAAAHATAGLQGAQALRGKTVVLVSATGEVVGNFLADGSLRVMGDLQQATDVVVTLSNGQRVTYDLAAEVSSHTNALGNIKVSDQGRNVALVSVLATLNSAAGVSGGASSNSAGSVSGEASSGAAGQGSAGASAGATGSVGGAASGSAASGSAGSGSAGSGSAGSGSSVGVGIGVGVGVGIKIGGGK